MVKENDLVVRLFFILFLAIFAFTPFACLYIFNSNVVLGVAILAIVWMLELASIVILIC